MRKIKRIIPIGDQLMWPPLNAPPKILRMSRMRRMVSSIDIVDLLQVT
jgi:hypothetical protein